MDIDCESEYEEDEVTYVTSVLELCINDEDE